MATTKAQAIARQLAAKLRLRLPALALTQSVDTDGNPTILIGAAAAGSEGAFLRVVSVGDAGALNGIGQAQANYAHHAIQMCVEIAINTIATDALLMAAVCAMGAQVQVYESADGDVPAVGELVVANLKATIDQDPVAGVIANA